MTTVAGDYDFGDQLKSVDFKNHRVILLTTHRRENLGEPMRHIYKALRRIIEEIPDTEIVFPVHRNPKVRKVVEDELSGVDRIHLIDPMEYEPFANLMSLSYLVLTDSGGIQEEAPSLGNRFWSCAIRRNGRKPLKPVRSASSAPIRTSSMPKRSVF